MNPPLVVSYGGGVNSTAMLIGMSERGITPDMILFADTGGELPEVYTYREKFAVWLTERGMPMIETVSKPTTYLPDGTEYTTLEENCLVKKMLPSLAYGFKGCSLKYKRQELDKRVNNWQPAKDCWARGEKVVRAIGYDFGEWHRKSIPEDAKNTYIYPLRDWQWRRRDCEEAIQRAGLCVPPKSACFFCPAAKKREVIELAKIHPDLFQRAVEIERNASGALTTVKGLGRHWTWEGLVESDSEQQKMFRDPPDIPCECWD